MNYKTTLEIVRGLGSASHVSQHWLAQRITAIALLPLTLWLSVAVVLLPTADYEAVTSWIASPGNAFLLAGFLIASVYHAMLGLQVVIEDYIHAERIKAAGIMACKLLLSFLGLAGLIAIIRIMFVG